MFRGHSAKKGRATVLSFCGIRAKITRTVRILMIAPEPFFEPRGTPFSEFHRIRALTALGHQVDLVTYPFGQNVSMPGLRVFRSLRPPFVRRVKIGPSLAKIPLDALLTVTAIRRALRRRLRRDPLPRGGRAHRRRARAGAARAAPLRHALEPAAAAHEFRVQPLARHEAGVSRDRALHDPPLARRHRHLPLARGHGEGDRARGEDGPDRERPGLRRRCRDAGTGRRRADIAGAGGLDAGRALHRHVRSVPGAGHAVRGDGDRPPDAARRASGPCRRPPRPGDARARTGARGRHRRGHASSPASGPRRRFRRIFLPPISSCRRGPEARTRR